MPPRAPSAVPIRSGGSPKTRFCNFVYRNAHGQQTHVRNGFARRLMQVRRVDCPGAVFNNCAPLPPYGAPGKAGVVAKLRFLAGYRFTIAFENTSADYYVSEKILHPLLAGSIPIYWGCPQVAEYYNPRALINCHDFASFDDVIAHVLAVDADPALQDAYRRAPMLRPDSRIHRLHRDLDTRHRASSVRRSPGAGCPTARAATGCAARRSHCAASPSSCGDWAMTCTGRPADTPAPCCTTPTCADAARRRSRAAHRSALPLQTRADHTSADILPARTDTKPWLFAGWKSVLPGIVRNRDGSCVVAASRPRSAKQRDHARAPWPGLRLRTLRRPARGLRQHGP